MNYSNEKPPNWDALVEKFGVSWDAVAVTYGDIIHVKYSPIERHVEVHESVHMVQQKQIGVETWWTWYMRDEDFRYQQELEAYQVQYKYIKSSMSNRNKVFDLLSSLAQDLSGPMYGNIVTYSEALKAIKND